MTTSTNQSRPTLILGSSSPARRMLLARLQLPFEVISPDIDETPLPDEDGHALVTRLARLKAEVIAKQRPDALIIAADQVGTLDNHLLNKPETYENAVKQLQLVSGKMIRFFTGMCVWFDGKHQLTVETYDVYFRQLNITMIEHYLRKEKPLHCAGSFQAEGLGISLIHKFAGDDYTSLIGLPLIRLSEMLTNTPLNPLN